MGDGDEVLLIPSRKLRKKHLALLEDWKEMCPQTGGKSIAVQDKGICFFPSDQGNFPLGVGIAAFRRKKGLGLYCARIHTPKDTVCEENNVILIRDFLIRILEKGK